jgi:DMSO/TMAO reductase YedYZ molybdopterin-dependent catalytic subunit
MESQNDTLPRITATVPEPTTGPLSFEELQLANRNRGLPLEALRYDITPTGLHYLLVHFDIPLVDAAAWRLRLGGRVKKEMSLSLEDLRSRPRCTLPVTFECAGNGRARLRHAPSASLGLTKPSAPPNGPGPLSPTCSTKPDSHPASWN